MALNTRFGATLDTDRMVSQFMAYDHRQCIGIVPGKHQVDQPRHEQDIFRRYKPSGNGVYRSVAV